jgi:hypothetical protein
MYGTQLIDPTSIRGVKYVMKGGTIFKNLVPTSIHT